MKKNSKNKKKDKKSLALIVIAILIILLICGSYAWLTITRNAKNTNTIISGTLKMELDEETSEGIRLLNAVPTTDEVGKSSSAYTFVIENTGDIYADYTIFLKTEPLDSLGDSTLKNIPQNRIKYNLKKVIKKKVGLEKNSSNDTVISTDDVGITNFLNSQYAEGTNSDLSDALDSGSIEPGNYIEYILVLWIDENATYEEMNNTAYIGRIVLNAQQKEIDE